VELWFGITILAAFLQNIRSVLQRNLTGQLSVNGAAYVRFLYAVPLAWLVAWWMWRGDFAAVTHAFFIYVTVGGIAQIVGTACLLGSFGGGNFAVGTAFSKTEAAQAAVFGLVVLGDAVTAWLLGGIAVSLIGVVLLSGNLRWQQLLRPNKGLWLGIAAGAGFAIAAIGFRGASLALADGTFLQRATLTVMCAVTLQTVIMGAYLLVREPGEMMKVMRAWRVAVWVGAIGMAASVGWFAAMTLKNAAVVRAVGQVELIFTVVTSVWLLGERLRSKDVAGMALIVLGIWLLV
jgi:drug/metabolite transporter (DMT)-like permease